MKTAEAVYYEMPPAFSFCTACGLSGIMSVFMPKWLRHFHFVCVCPDTESCGFSELCHSDIQGTASNQNEIVSGLFVGQDTVVSGILPAGSMRDKTWPPGRLTPLP